MRTAWIPSALLLAALGSAIPGPAGAGDCSEQFAGQANGNSYAVMFLMGGGTLFPGAKQIADRVLGDWYTYDLRGVAARVDADSLADGVSMLCRFLDSQGRPSAARSASRIRTWVECYQLTDQLSGLVGVEPLASAIALCPETRAVFPGSDELIRTLGMRVGENLAGAQHPGLRRGLATLLAGRPQAERAHIVAELLDLGRKANGWTEP